LCHSLEPLRLRLLLERWKVISSAVDQIPAELIQEGWVTLHSEIHKLTKFILKKKNCHTSGKSQLSYLFTKRISVTVVNEAYHCCQLPTKCYPTFFSLG
jgi:hypothetical protein